MKKVLFTFSLQLFLISCTNNQNSISNPPLNDTSIGDRVEPMGPNEGNTSNVINLNKINFSGIIFGGTLKEWNKYAADRALADPYIELDDQLGEYHIKANTETNQNLYSIEDRPVFKNMAEGVSATPVKIDGNTTDKFLQMVVRVYSDIDDPNIVNSKVAELIKQYNLTYKYGYSNLEARVPNLDPNDPFFKLYQDFEDNFEQSGSNNQYSNTTDNTPSYIGKKKNSHSAQLCLFESGEMYVSLNIITNSSYTVDKIGDKYTVHDDVRSSYVLEMELFPKTYAPKDVFEKYASTNQKSKRANQLKTQELIEKTRN
jgi:hypothetical protein